MVSKLTKNTAKTKFTAEGVEKCILQYNVRYEYIMNTAVWQR